jgi:hypothetical protein
MKTYLPLAIVLALLLFLPSADANIPGFVDLPGQVESGITSAVIWGISWLFVQLLTLIPLLKFLDEFKLPLSMAVSAQLIAWIERVVPDAFGGVAIAGIIFVLAILALFGVGEVLRQRGASGFTARR